MKLLAHRLEQRALVPDLRVAVQAELRRRDAGVRRSIDRVVAVAAVDAFVARVVPVIELDRLLDRDPACHARTACARRASGRQGTPAAPAATMNRQIFARVLCLGRKRGLILVAQHLVRTLCHVNRSFLRVVTQISPPLLVPCPPRNKGENYPQADRKARTDFLAHGRALSREADGNAVRVDGKMNLRAASEADLAHHEAGQQPDHQHDQAPRSPARRPRACRGRSRATTSRATPSGSPANGGGLQARGHAGPHEARLHADRAQPLGAELVVEPLEVAREARLGGAVEDDRLAPALAGDRAEHAQRAAAAREQPLARLLAEQRRCSAKSAVEQRGARARGRPPARPASRTGRP